MRPAPTAVQDLLKTRQFIFADCFTFELADGTVLRFTSAQTDVITIPVDGSLVVQTYTSRSVKCSGLKMKLQVGVSVDEQDLNISYKPTDMLYGVPWGAAVALGFLDGAIIRRDRFFAPAWAARPGLQPAWAGGTPMFMGRVSTIDEIGRQDIKMKVKSYLVLANINMPKELQQPSCRNILFDARCKLSASGFLVNGAVGAGSTEAVVNWSGAAANFSLGTISMENGNAVGQSRTIKLATGSQLILNSPFSFEIATGDLFAAFPGCDKTTGVTSPSGQSCTDYANLANHTGFPYVPPPETAA